MIIKSAGATITVASALRNIPLLRRLNMLCEGYPRGRFVFEKETRRLKI